MKSLTEMTPPREAEWRAEPLHVFADRSGTDVELHVYADHLELHSTRRKEVHALWFRHIHALDRSCEAGSEALAIVDGSGQVFIVPMTSDQVMEARWLVASLME